MKKYKVQIKTMLNYIRRESKTYLNNIKIKGKNKKMKENTLISLQLPKELLEQVKSEAESLNISMAAYIRMKLTEEMRKNK